jgi:hypothetical protein
MRYKIVALIAFLMACSAVCPARADMSINTFELNIAQGGAPALAARNYISGIEDGLSWANVGSNILHGVRLYCPLGALSLTETQIIDILRRFVQTHNVNTQERVGSILLVALQQLFPCQQSGRR